ncbi:MAG: TetR/AcrR family transcriptional regulator [Leptonema sp. (in: Bacteria)]|nr:TetR/AcrR family transcriptional regulator [Leptonema sp. (in: bacteria)]
MTKRLTKKNEQNAIESKEMILDSAFHLFAKVGFHGASTKKIAQQAGVSEGLIFHYFENKVAILLALMQRFVAGSIQKKIAKSLKNREDDSLETILCDIFDIIEKKAREGRMAGIVRIVFNSLMTLPEPDREYFARSIHDTLWLPLTESLTDRISDSNIDPYILFRMIQGSIMGYIFFQEILGWKRFVELDPVQYRNTMAKILADAVAQSKIHNQNLVLQPATKRNTIKKNPTKKANEDKL